MKRSIDWQMDELCSIIAMRDEEIKDIESALIEAKMNNEDGVLNDEIIRMEIELDDRDDEMTELEDELDLAESGHSEFGYTDEDLYE